jgi:hypothetical protein
MPSASTAAKRDKRYTLRENDLITVAECNALIRNHLRQFARRVRYLLAASFVLLAVIAVFAVWFAR